MRHKKAALVLIGLLVLSLVGVVWAGSWLLSRETVTIPAGTSLAIRLTTGLSSKNNESGDNFEGTLENAVVVDGKVVIPEGSGVAGEVTYAEESGRLKDRAELWVTLTEVNGYGVTTTTTGRKEGSKTKRNVLLIGGGGGIGALIGALTGGGSGAAIGAGVGAGGGTAAAALTGKRDIKFPPETRLYFRLKEDLDVEVD